MKKTKNLLIKIKDGTQINVHSDISIDSFRKNMATEKTISIESKDDRIIIPAKEISYVRYLKQTKKVE